MAGLTIYRGTHQIGGCCTEITCGRERILIDFGANLPDCNSFIRDDELVARVFDGRPVTGLLFTHLHGDHYGLYKKVPKGVDMYIGSMSKEILKVLVSRLDYISEEKGLPVIEGMQTYQAGNEMEQFRNIRITPFYVDHSAPDAHMFYLETAGKRILFTGDFRDHGIIGERDRLWRTLEKYVPKGIDLLITEGTMLNRKMVSRRSGIALTEAELGQRAEEVFQQHKYNFVLVSSTNLDSIMEFYHHTPTGMCFVCDAYQAEVMLTAMIEMKKKGNYPMYQAGPKLHVLNGAKRWPYLRKLGMKLKKSVLVEPASPESLKREGFVMLVRKNLNLGKKSVFEEMRDEYYPLDGQIIYSMWEGYLERGKAYTDPALLSYIGDRPYESLHTSGHAYVGTIAKLIETVNPKAIVPMHTERAEEFSSIPAFAAYRDRIIVCQDGVPVNLAG